MPTDKTGAEATVSAAEGKYTIAVDGETVANEGGPFPWHSMRPNMLVDDVTIVKREEWIADGTAPGSPALASNQTLIDAGPVGSAPSAAVKITVSCGLTLRARAHGNAILLYLNDFPGILGVSTDQTEIDDFTRRFTEVPIVA